MNGTLSFPALGLSVAVLVLAVAAGPALAQHGILVKSGDPAPDGDGVYSTGGGYNMGAPAINDLGQILFAAALSGSSSGSDIVTLVAPDGTLTEVARERTSPPFGTVDYGALYSASQPAPSISHTGIPVFLAKLGSDDAVIVGSAAAALPVAIDGDAVGGGAELFVWNLPPAINSANQVAFAAGLTGTAGGSADDQAIYRFDGPGLPLVGIVRQGDPAPGGGTLTGLALGSWEAFAPAALNEAGQVAFEAAVDGSGVPFDRRIFVSDGSTLTQIVGTGDPAPGGSTFSSIHAPSLNDQGQVSFYARLADGSVGIFLGDGATIRVLARNGTLLPGGDTLTSIGQASALNNAGQVVFASNTAAHSSGAGARAGLFRADGDGVVAIAVEGDVTPLGDSIFRSISNGAGYNFAINDAGQIAFMFSIDFDPTNVTPLEGTALFFFDDEHGHFEIVRTGMELLGSTIAQITFAGTSGGDYAPDERSGLNAGGTVAFRYALANGDDGIVACNVLERLPGDVDGDNEVTVLDVIAAVTAFGTHPGDDRWDPQSDFDEDDEITVIDIIIVVTNFSATRWCGLAEAT